ncbi:hypothetical protein EMCRGX_G025566 [Ephydatia muelleri]
MGLGFYRFPFKNEGRLRRWIQAVRREDWQPSKYSRICGDHFVSCKPVDEPSDVAMSLHDSLSRTACKRKYLIKMMAVKARQTKAGQRRKGEDSQQRQKSSVWEV